MAGLKNAHMVRGYNCEALEDKFIQAVIKGRINLDSLKEKKPKLAVTVGMMRQLREKIKRVRGSYEFKRMLWLVCVWMFLGSLRVSEILGDNKWSYDPIKTLLSADIERFEAHAGGEEVTMLNKTAENIMLQPNAVCRAAKTRRLVMSGPGIRRMDNS